MRLKISKSKNTILFYIIKDYTRNGKRSTKIVKRIGNLEEVKTMAGKMDYKEWLKKYVQDFNEKNCIPSLFSEMILQNHLPKRKGCARL